MLEQDVAESKTTSDKDIDGATCSGVRQDVRDAKRIQSPCEPRYLSCTRPLLRTIPKYRTQLDTTRHNKTQHNTTQHNAQPTQHNTTPQNTTIHCNIRARPHLIDETLGVTKMCRIEAGAVVIHHERNETSDEDNMRERKVFAGRFCLWQPVFPAAVEKDADRTTCETTPLGPPPALFFAEVHRLEGEPSTHAPFFPSSTSEFGGVRVFGCFRQLQGGTIPRPGQNATQHETLKRTQTVYASQR